MADLITPPSLGEEWAKGYRAALDDVEQLVLARIRQLFADLRDDAATITRESRRQARQEAARMAKAAAE